MRYSLSRDVVRGPLLTFARATVPACAAVVALCALLPDRSVHNPPLLLPILNITFLTGVSALICITAGMGYLSNGSNLVLLLGCGALALASGSFIAVVPIGRAAPNWSVALYGSSSLAAAACNLLGATAGSTLCEREQGMVWPALASRYAAVGAAVLCVTLAASAGDMPIFFVDGTGLTQIGVAVFWSASALSAAAAVILQARPRSNASGFTDWYAVGLAFMAVGLAGVSFQRSFGSLLNWAGRACQYLGGLCMLGAVISQVRRGGGWAISLEQRLPESKERMRSILESSSDSIFFVDEESGRIRDANDVACTLYGYTRSELLHMTIGDISAEPLLSLVSLKDHVPTVPLRYHRKKDGTVFPVEISASCFTLGGRTYHTAFIRDITARRQVEEALLKSEAQLSNAASLARLGPWEYDMATDLFTFNDLFYAIFRTTAERVGGYTMSSADYARRFVHPDDRTMVRAEICNALETTDPHFTRHIEHRMVYAGGEVGHVSVRFVAVRNNAGKTVKTYGVNQDITETKRAEEALRRSEAALKAAQRAAHVGSWSWNIAADRLEWSDEMFAIYGLDRENFSGSLSELVRCSIRSCRRVVQRGVPVALEYEITRPDGEVRTVWAEPSRVLRHEDSRTEVLSGVVLDVTERKKAEEELRESERVLRAVFDKAPVGIVLMDALSNEILTANSRFARIVGRTQEQCVGLDLLDIVDPHDKAQVTSLRKRPLGSTDSHHGEARFMRPDASAAWVDFSVVPLWSTGERPTILLALVEDVTEKREAERIRREQQRQLVHAERMASLGMLVAGVAHEINNPNHTIGLNAGMISRVWESISPVLEEYRRKEGNFVAAGIWYDELRTEAPACIHGISTASAHIESIVSQLRSFAQSDENPETVVVDPNMVVQAAVTLTANLLKKTTGAFTLRLGENLPFVLGNFSRLEQVIINLIQNACDAVSSSKQSIEVFTSRDPRTGWVCMGTRDEGIGMSEETLKRIAEPFFTTKRERGGMGLGVPISRSIVTAHGGELLYESALGKGTTATIILPPYAQSQTEAMA